MSPPTFCCPSFNPIQEVKVVIIYHHSLLEFCHNYFCAKVGILLQSLHCVSLFADAGAVWACLSHAEVWGSLIPQTQIHPFMSLKVQRERLHWHGWAGLLGLELLRAGGRSTKGIARNVSTPGSSQGGQIVQNSGCENLWCCARGWKQSRGARGAARSQKNHLASHEIGCLINYNCVSSIPRKQQREVPWSWAVWNRLPTETARGAQEKCRNKLRGRKGDHFLGDSGRWGRISGAKTPLGFKGRKIWTNICSSKRRNVEKRGGVQWGGAEVCSGLKRIPKAISELVSLKDVGFDTTQSFNNLWML